MKLQFSNFISQFLILSSLASTSSTISFLVSIIGIILFAADSPVLILKFKVARDLTGWYASIIAAKKEKKLFIANSPVIISLPE